MKKKTNNQQKDQNLSENTIKTLQDFGGSVVRYNNYLEISKMFRDYDARVKNKQSKRT